MAKDLIIGTIDTKPGQFAARQELNVKSNIGQLIAISAINMMAGIGTYKSPLDAPIFNATPRAKSLGGDNKKSRPGAQMAHIRAARKARNQRRARVANRRAK